MKLTGKIFINGTIEAETGLRIGGNKSSLEIGGVDLNIIKTGRGLPYIPGSSLKGKLRSLVAKVRGYEKVENEKEPLPSFFGSPGANDMRGVTRFFIRDAHLDTSAFEGTFGKKEERILDFEFSEIKTENRIDRSRGTAEHPRQIERVPAGSFFNLDIQIDFYQDDNQEEYMKLLKEALQLLRMDYLGGHGSRGSGRVKIHVSTISGKEITPGEIKDMDCRKWNDLFADFIHKPKQVQA